MTDDLREYILQWYEKADHDLIAAKALIDSAPLILDVVGFHCQQAAEKYIKAYLIFKGFDIERTHDLVLLKRRAEKFLTAFSEIDFARLNQFAVHMRYPNYPESPTMSEAKRFLEMAGYIKELVRSQINLD